MKTSVQWWNEVKVDAVKTEDWLKKQWRGEVTAVFRIKRLAHQFVDPESREAKVLHAIAEQEKTHAEWVGDLLKARGINMEAANLEEAENRYWAQTLPGITSLPTGAAVAAHAEGMRLERIRAIASDEDAPADIREVFTKILKDEEWHERAFTELSTPEAMIATEGSHELGRTALGLEA